MANCGCGSSETIIRLDNGDGTFTYPPVIDGVEQADIIITSP